MKFSKTYFQGYFVYNALNYTLYLLAVSFTLSWLNCSCNKFHKAVILKMLVISTGIKREQNVKFDFSLQFKRDCKIRWTEWNNSTLSGRQSIDVCWNTSCSNPQHRSDHRRVDQVGGIANLSIDNLRRLVQRFSVIEILHQPQRSPVCPCNKSCVWRQYF